MPDAGVDADGTPSASGGPDKGKQDKKDAKNKGKGEGKEKGKEKDKSKADDKALPTPPSTAASAVSAATSRTTRAGGGAAANRLSVNTAVSASTSIAAVTALQSPGSALSAVGADLAALQGRWDVVPASQSPDFPRTLAALVALTTEQARALVREYGLVSEDEEDENDRDENATPVQARGGKAVRGDTSTARGARGGGPGAQSGKTQRPASMATACSDASSWANAGLAGTREDDLNKFMRYIGVSFFRSVVRWCSC